jgi:hypothetical protein
MILLNIIADGKVSGTRPVVAECRWGHPTLLLPGIRCLVAVGLMPIAVVEVRWRMSRSLIQEVDLSAQAKFDYEKSDGTPAFNMMATSCATSGTWIGLVVWQDPGREAFDSLKIRLSGGDRSIPVLNFGLRGGYRSGPIVWVFLLTLSRVVYGSYKLGTLQRGLTGLNPI